MVEEVYLSATPFWPWAHHDDTLNLNLKLWHWLLTRRRVLYQYQKWLSSNAQDKSL